MSGPLQNPVELRGDSLVAGEWWGRERRAGITGAHVFRAENPATGEMLDPECVCAAPEWVDAAATAAGRACATYRELRGDERAALLERIAVELEAVRTQLIERASAETGLSGPRLEMEFARTVDTLRMFAGVVRGEAWKRPAIEPPAPGAPAGTIPAHDLRRTSVAIGPVAVFGASNFPLAYGVAGGDTASALAAGCPVCVKGHPSHPGTGEIAAAAVARAVRALGMDPGVFSYLHSGGEDETKVGAALVAHPSVRGVGFTGSFGGGMALARAAASRPTPIPVFAEMGSANPIYVLPGAARERGAAIAEELTASILNSSGQQCTCAGILFVVGDESGRSFVDILAKNLDAATSNVMLSRRVRAGYHARVMACLAVSGVSGTATLSGFAATEPASKGPVAAPAGLMETDFKTFTREDALREEVFGPAVLVVRCASIQEVATAPDHVRGSLVTGVYASDRDAELGRTLMLRLLDRAGRVVWNGVTTGVRVAEPMVHAGPYPSTNRPEATAVGAAAIQRWVRPVCFQNMPDEMLPSSLHRA